MRTRLKAKTESNKQKDTRIAELEDQLAELKDQIQALDSELVLKNDHIAEYADKEQNSTDFPKVKAPNQLSKSTVYMMKNDQICEIIEKNGKIKVIQREREEERSDFILWIENKQLCGSNCDKKWTLSLYSGTNKLDTIKILGNDGEYDKFYLIGNRVYIGLWGTYELYRVTVKGEKMKLESFGQTNSRLSSVCEYRNCFFVGLCDNTVQQVKDEEFTTILQMSSAITNLKVENNCLLASDCSGKVIKYNLISKKTEKKAKVDNEYSFLLGDKIGSFDKNNLYIYDWKRVQLTKFVHSANSFLHLLKQTDKYSIVAWDSCLLIIDHSTLTVRKQTTRGIPWRYLNC